MLIKLLRYYFLIITLLFTTIVASAAVGCRIGNIIHTSQYGGINATVVIAVITYGNFYTNPILSTQAPSCPRAANVTPVAGLINLCVLDGSIFNAGTMVNYDRLDPPVQCPLDDYTFPLTASAGIFGFLFIRRKKLF